LPNITASPGLFVSNLCELGGMVYQEAKFLSTKYRTSPVNPASSVIVVRANAPRIYLLLSANHLRYVGYLSFAFVVYRVCPVSGSILNTCLCCPEFIY
jgi:hypothetical protein